MSKDDSLAVPGTVIEVLPHMLYKVEIEGGRVIIGHLAGKLRMHSIKIAAGDRVTIEVSAYDLTRGRITYCGTPKAA